MFDQYTKILIIKEILDGIMKNLHNLEKTMFIGANICSYKRYVFITLYVHLC